MLARSPKAGRPQSRDAIRTRQAILDSAELCFSREGLRGTRTESIASECGVTKAMIHYYFDTKEKLYEAVLERVFLERVEGMDFETLRHLPPIDALDAFVERLLGQMMRKPHLGPLFALENIQNEGAYYARFGGEIYRVLTSILERGMHDRSFRANDPRHTAINVMGACVHYFNITENVRKLWPNVRSSDVTLAAAHSGAAKAFITDALLTRRRARRDG